MPGQQAIWSGGGHSFLIGSARIRRPGEIHRRPLPGGHHLLLAGDPLDRDGVDGDDVEPREETFRPSSIGLAVFLHQHFAESLPGGLLIDNTDRAEQDDAGVSETGIALEASIIEHLLRFIDLEANA